MKKENIKEPEMVDHIVTEEDLILNPEWANEGIKIGDTIQYEKEEEIIPEADPVITPEVTEEIIPAPVVDENLPSWMLA